MSRSVAEDTYFLYLGRTVSKALLAEDAVILFQATLMVELPCMMKNKVKERVVMIARTEIVRRKFIRKVDIPG